MWTRCNPAILRAGRLVADGAIGRVTTVHADFGVAGPFPPEHRMRAKALGGGALLDLGIYSLTMSQWLMALQGKIQAPRAHVTGKRSTSGVDVRVTP